MAVLLVAVTVVGAALRGALDGVADRDPADVPALRVAGERYAGVALQARLLDDAGYATLADRAYGAVTPENELKWEVVQPAAGRFEFATPDRIVKWARERGKRVRGHALVWHLQNPGWLEPAIMASRGAATAALRRHITTVMRRYRGRVAEWDVVNEAVADTGGLRDTLWLRALGPGYIDMAFRFAREADPDARLVYNDYGAEGTGPKSRGVLALLRGLRERGVPVDAVGLQGHVSTEPVPELDATLAAYAALGLDVLLTEVDVRLAVDAEGRPAGGPSALRDQASGYARLAGACVRLPACKGFVVWGLDDADSWVPQAYPGEGAALPFDGELRPKPAWRALLRSLAGRDR